MLASKMENLPEELQKERLDFVEYLIEKHEDKFQSKSRKTPTFGSCKGLFVIPSDFDEPAEDFQEYME
jgi:hypothetical protein